MRKTAKSLLVAAGALVFLWSHCEAQSAGTLVGRTKFTRKIRFECATSKYRKRPLAKVVRAAMKGLDVGDIGVWGNRAVAFDLNKDGKLEYFIPLDCGGDGNCNWGVFALDPPRRLGRIAAEEIYIQQNAGWPILAAYIHSSASEGIISVYKYAGVRYVKSSGDFEVSADRKDFPKSMEKARSTCEPVNTSAAKRKIEGRRSSGHE